MRDLLVCTYSCTYLHLTTTMLAKILLVVALVACAKAGLLGHGVAVDLHTPPKYEFKYGVADAHTGDNKQQSEVRVGDVTKDQYSLKEHDRIISVLRIIAGGHPVVSQGIVSHGVGLGGLGGLGGGLGIGLGGHGIL